jgi:hypothetical protein
MFDKIGQAAEKVALGASRREFFGSFSRWAGAAALAVAGVLTVPGTVVAGEGRTCCRCVANFGGSVTVVGCVKMGDPCPACGAGSTPSNITVKNCNECKGPYATG